MDTMKKYYIYGKEVEFLSCHEPGRLDAFYASINLEGMIWQSTLFVRRKEIYKNSQEFENRCQILVDEIKENIDCTAQDSNLVLYLKAVEIAKTNLIKAQKRQKMAQWLINFHNTFK